MSMIIDLPLTPDDRSTTDLFKHSLLSSVVERWSRNMGKCKPKAESSILSGGTPLLT